jgi:hypothetical protein
MADYRKRFRDRYDGRLIRSIDPFYRIIPYIMRTRSDAQNLFDDKIDISRLEAFLRAKRNAGIKNIGFLHIVIAAMVRTISQKPGINRFIAGQRIYARDDIFISLVVKKPIDSGEAETTIKLKFKPEDTLSEVVSKLNSAIEENKKANVKNNTDKTARIFMMCPGFLVRLLIWFIKVLDYYGIMPKILNDLSPFHTSVFVTDLGSLGIQPVYHHLYEIGTTSVFVAFGTKYKEKHINRENRVVEKKYVSMRIVADERIVDGYYYASAFKLFRSLMQSPEKLELPPDKVVEDIW